MFLKAPHTIRIDFCMLILLMVGRLRETVGTSTEHSGSGSRRGGGRRVIARGWTCPPLSGSARTTCGRPLRDGVVSFHLVAIHPGRRQFHPIKLGPVSWTDLSFDEPIPSRADTLNQPVPHPNCKRFLPESARSRVGILVERLAVPRMRPVGRAVYEPRRRSRERCVGVKP